MTNPYHTTKSMTAKLNTGICKILQKIIIYKTSSAVAEMAMECQAV